MRACTQNKVPHTQLYSAIVPNMLLYISTLICIYLIPISKAIGSWNLCLFIYIGRWVLPNPAMKKKVRWVRYIKNMKVRVRSYYSGIIVCGVCIPSLLDCYRNLLNVLPDSCPFLCYLT